MTQKEIATLRRRFRSDRTNINRICGCFVSSKGEILSEFEQGLGLLAEEDTDVMLGFLKKTMSGALRRNLLEIEFSTAQVLEGEEHKLLTELRNSELANKEAVRALFDKIIGAYVSEDNYVILLAHDRCDIFGESADGGKDYESTSSFSYVICAVCPVKEGKTVMSYYMPGSCFRSVAADSVVSMPQVGFMFPVLEDKGANIYKSLYYTKDLGNNREALLDALFAAEKKPMPAIEQKATFGSMLEETMEDDCSMGVVKAVHGQLCNMIEEHKHEKTDEPLVISKNEAGSLLRCCGVSAERVEAFEEKFEEAFGRDAEINPGNLAENKRIQVSTPDVTIKVSPGHGDLLETRVIDGIKYILVRADSDVEVNGVNIQI